MNNAVPAPAVWKKDAELGIAFFCSKCHRFVCSTGYCDCGAYVNLNLPKEEYKGKAKWENYSRRQKNEQRNPF